MSDILRRTPEAILVAHQLDPHRIELFVEGVTDRHFVEWLTDPTRSEDALVREMTTVEIDQGHGGERGRLIAFATQIDGRHERIRFFADADWDRLLGIAQPTNVWLTDPRDIEGYFFRRDCIEKILRVGIGTTSVDADDVLQDVRRIARRVGLLRVLSARTKQHLSFQNTSLWRHLTATRGRVEFNEEGFMRSLLQNSDLSLGELENWQSDLDQIEHQMESVDSAQVIHGKDALEVLAKAFSCFGVRKEDTTALVRTSFERGLVEQGSTLEDLVSYLSP